MNIDQIKRGASIIEQQLVDGKIWSMKKIIMWWSVWVVAVCVIFYVAALGLYCVAKNNSTLKKLFMIIIILILCTYIYGSTFWGLYLTRITKASNEVMQLIAREKD